MSQKPTKSPIRPILLAPFVEIHKPEQKQGQIENITVISSSQGIESTRRPHQTLNAEQNSIDSTSSSNKISQRDSPDSLKKQIRDISQYSFQQVKLIKKLHLDLVRAELVTGNQSLNSNIQENTYQLDNLTERLDYLVDSYISQHEKLKKKESGVLEQQSNAQINELNHQITQLKAEIENQNNLIHQLTNELHEQSEENILIKSYLFTLKDKTPTSITYYDLNDYTFDSVIGSGATSNVNAVYKKEKYAQKELKNFTFDQFKLFLAECEILFKLHHPCIIRVHGFNNGDENHAPTMMLSLEQISLENAIHDSLLNNHQKNRIIVEIVLGMRYIHKHNIMHRDLKPLNILLSKNMHARISDFGLAKEEDIEISQTRGIGTVRFMAPELFLNEDDDDDDENKVIYKNTIRYTKKVDVYSFGMTLIYIVTDKYPPFKMKEAVTGVIPKIKGPIIDWVRDLIVRCLSNSPDDRPSFSEIFEIIKSHDYDLFNDEQTEDHEFEKKEIQKRIQKIEAFEYQHQND